MRIIKGKSVFSGIAIGRISVLQQEEGPVKRCHIGDSDKEIQRLSQGREKAKG